MKVFALLLVGTTVCLAYLWLRKDKILYGEQTVYSFGYKESNFKKVLVGMSVEQVVDLLGKPLSQSTQMWSEVWIYVPTNAEPASSTSSKDISIFNVFGEITRLDFSESGRVTKKSGYYLEGDFVGLDKVQIQTALGRASQCEIKQFEQIYRYAAPANFGTFKIREIHFDVSNKVSSVLATTHYD